jgi:hypothetical protein
MKPKLRELRNPGDLNDKKWDGFDYAAIRSMGLMVSMISWEIISNALAKQMTVAFAGKRSEP